MAYRQLRTYVAVWSLVVAQCVAYETTEEPCAEELFISTARECELAASVLGVSWNNCCQNNNNLPYGCLKRANDVIWNGNSNTPNKFPCTVPGNCDHGMRWAVCREADEPDEGLISP